MKASEKRDGPILVLNSGSSSLKFGVFQQHVTDEDAILEGSAEGIGRETGSLKIRSSDGSNLIARDHTFETQEGALQKISATIAEHLPQMPVVAVGHRIVHGGAHLRKHQLITPQVVDQLKAAVHFAPLHIPESLKLIDQTAKLFPDCPQFACFDTSFHSTMPKLASQLPIPARYADQGVIRYGFHGISYESIVHRLGKSLPSRAIFAHLGSGSSLVAVRDGKSIDTSMGLTPTGGILMGTRSGDLDPGVLLYLMRTESMSADALEDLLNHESGLYALSAGESDMQELLSRIETGDAAAQLAVLAFTTAGRKCIGAYAALLGGVDALVFTGGIGQHSTTVRERICEGLEFMGLHAASGKVIILPTEEERQIARHCRLLLVQEQTVPD